MLASRVVREAGIRVQSIGPSTPYETVGMAMSRYGAPLCVIRLTSPPATRTRARWHAIGRAVADRAGAIILGGRGSRQLPIQPPAVFRIGDSMTELAAFVQGWLETDGQAKPRKERGS